MIMSLEKYHHGSITLALLIKGHSMSITCGLQLGWPEEDEVGIATRWHGQHRPQG
jgi:hypothetical protein